ncbi:MAG TPA: TIR domain-containing protein [Bryobacteraceae bacterium]|jgi:hypothetical protein|nr:TIR domain-containing protein [Bryobacteraceae bacterium]
MREVFISYRRQDDMARAGRIADFLTDHLDGTKVFMDVHGILPGEDFVKKISETLSRCAVFVPVIGPRWLSARRRGRRRLFLPNDFVRLEIMVALDRSIPIIPVLVGGAAMPGQDALPKSIAGFASRQAVEVSDKDFRDQATGLTKAVQNTLLDSPSIEEQDLRLEYARVERLIQSDIDLSQRHERRSLVARAGSTLVVFAAGAVLWATLLRPKAEPHYSQARVIPDEVRAKVAHPNDTDAWHTLSDPAHGLRPQSFPQSRGGAEPVLKLQEVLGSRGPEAVAAIKQSGAIVFQSVGSTGNVNHLEYMHLVPGAMSRDFNRSGGHGKPSFLLLLGDLILNFGEREYYYDQFYEPYRNYPAPILALAGNHDGIVALGSASRTLDAFLDNFCAMGFHKTANALNLDRTAQIQPGVYFTLEAPFIRIVALYSNVLEEQGIISREGGAVPELSDVQLSFLDAALSRIRDEHFSGAVIVAVHHDVYRSQPKHPLLSPGLRADLDAVFRRTGVWPHAVISGHAHNYERFTRAVDGMTIPYVVAGTGGSNLARVPAAPMALQADGGSVNLEASASKLGYLRITVDLRQLLIEFVPTGGDSAGKATDTVTVDLGTRKIVPNASQSPRADALSHS